MTAKSEYRGHKIEYINNEWVYSDNKQPTATTHKLRPCGNCSKPETKEGHDACLGELQGVMNACCGHGKVNEAYVQFNDKTIISGQMAIDVCNKIKETAKKCLKHEDCSDCPLSGKC